MARVDGLINVCCRPNVACRLLKSYRAGLLRHRSECTPTADALSSSELSIASSLAGVVLQMCFDEFVVQAWPTASVSSAATSGDLGRQRGTLDRQPLSKRPLRCLPHRTLDCALDDLMNDACCRSRDHRMIAERTRSQRLPSS